MAPHVYVHQRIHNPNLTIWVRLPPAAAAFAMPPLMELGEGGWIVGSIGRRMVERWNRVGRGGPSWPQFRGWRILGFPLRRWNWDLAPSANSGLRSKKLEEIKKRHGLGAIGRRRPPSSKVSTFFFSFFRGGEYSRPQRSPHIFWGTYSLLPLSGRFWGR